MVADLLLGLDEALALLQALLELIYERLLLFVKGLSAYNSTIASTKDEELAVPECHVEHDSIAVLAAVASVGKLSE